MAKRMPSPTSVEPCPAESPVAISPSAVKRGAFRGEQAGMILQRVGSSEGGSKTWKALREAIQVRARVGLDIWPDHADAQAHTVFAMRERPGVTRRRDLAAHDQVERVLVI